MEISVRFQPRGRCKAKHAAPGPDCSSFRGKRLRGATLSGGLPVHQEPEHGLVGADAGQSHRRHAGISGHHGSDLERPKAKRTALALGQGRSREAPCGVVRLLTLIPRHARSTG